MINKDNDTKVQRAYKDGMFRSIFNSKEKILELFNAIEGTNYDINSKFEIKTLEDAIYITGKNDIAFLLEDRFVVLIEHQSTINPNMPLRMLSYISRVYEKMYRDRAIYSSRKINIAVPEFIVLYNGDKETADNEIIKLSSLYGESPPENSLELVVRFINICYNKNKKLLKHSQELMGYSLFIYYVKESIAANNTKEEAIKYAIKRCLSEGILEDFLSKHGSEVINMLFEEITLEEYGDIREADGVKLGLEQGVKQGQQQGILSGKIDSIIEILEIKGDLSADLLDTLKAQNDISVLNRWVKLAVLSQSIEEFKEKAGL